MFKRIFLLIITYLVVTSCFMPYSWVESNESITFFILKLLSKFTELLGGIDLFDSTQL